MEQRSAGNRYDALGRRVSKTVPDGEGSATTVFVGTIQALEYSPHAMQVVTEYAADAVPASPERKFVYAEYIDEPVMMVDETALGSTGAGTEEPYYYHQNSLYSVAAVTDATGTVVERYAYSAYGKPIFLDAAANLLNPQASAIGNPYLFAGRRMDEETDLYYYRARMYDAELGRFVGRDPIGYLGGINLYGYVENSPIDRKDPYGLKMSQNKCEFVCTVGYLFCCAWAGESGVGFIACTLAYLSCLDGCESSSAPGPIFPPVQRPFGDPRKLTEDTTAWCVPCPGKSVPGDPENGGLLPSVPVTCTGTCQLNVNADGSITGALDYQSVKETQKQPCPKDTERQEFPPGSGQVDVSACIRKLQNKCDAIAKKLEKARANGGDSPGPPIER